MTTCSTNRRKAAPLPPASHLPSIPTGVEQGMGIRSEATGALGVRFTDPTVPLETAHVRWSGTRRRNTWHESDCRIGASAFPPIRRLNSGDIDMRYAFRVKSTFAAEVTLDLDKQRIVKEVVTEAEKLDLRQGESAIFHVDGTSLKAVVDFVARTGFARKLALA